MEHNPSNIDQLIPHRPPICLVERLERADGNGAVVRANVGKGDLGVREDGSVEPLILLEIIAQACAAHGGWLATHRAFADKAGSNATAVAFLVGVRSFEVLGSVKAGEAMEVEVKLVREFGGFHLFEGNLRQFGQELARASLKAYHPKADGIMPGGSEGRP